MIGEKEAKELNQAFYVSYQVGTQRFIQVSPLLPTYLKQQYEQSVSANVFIPDDEIISTLNNHFANRNECTAADLYLKKINRS